MHSLEIIGVTFKYQGRGGGRTQVLLISSLYIIRIIDIRDHLKWYIIIKGFLINSSRPGPDILGKAVSSDVVASGNG